MNEWQKSIIDVLVKIARRNDNLPEKRKIVLSGESESIYWVIQDGKKTLKLRFAKHKNDRLKNNSAKDKDMMCLEYLCLPAPWWVKKKIGITPGKYGFASVENLEPFVINSLKKFSRFVKESN